MNPLSRTPCCFGSPPPHIAGNAAIEHDQRVVRADQPDQVCCPLPDFRVGLHGTPDRLYVFDSVTFRTIRRNQSLKAGNGNQLSRNTLGFVNPGSVTLNGGDHQIACALQHFGRGGFANLPAACTAMKFDPCRNHAHQGRIQSSAEHCDVSSQRHAVAFQNLPQAHQPFPNTANGIRLLPFQFVQEVRTEVAKVTWPTWKEVWVTSLMVLLMVVLASLFFLLADQVIGVFVKALLGLGS